MDSNNYLEFLKSNTWTPAKQQELVSLWNELRGKELGLITMSHVRTPCRLKQVRDSLVRFVKSETPA